MTPGQSTFQNRGLLFGVYLTYVLVFVLTPFTPRSFAQGTFTIEVWQAFEGLDGFSSITAWDIWTNILLFMPFGFLFATVPGVSFRSKGFKLVMGTVAGCCVSTGIELFQTLLPRHPSASDIVLNTLGAFLGGGIRLVAFRLNRLDRGVNARAFGGGFSPALLLSIYVFMLCALFGIPVPLAKDFTQWTSEFDLHLGEEDTSGRRWSGRIYLISLYDRVLSDAEIRTNFLAGAVRGAGLPRVVNGQVLFYEFSQTGPVGKTGVSGSAVPLDIRLKDPSRVQWLVPNGLAVWDTSVSLLSRPANTLSGESPFAHHRFSVETWIAPSDWKHAGTVRIVAYAPHPEHGFFPFTEWKREVALSFQPPIDRPARNVTVASAARQMPGKDLRHVVATYADGVKTLYVDGTEVETTQQRYKNASIDRLVGLVGLPFEWPLYSVALFPLGYLGFRARTDRYAPFNAGWVALATPLMCPLVLQVVRTLTLDAPIESSLVLVGTCTALVSLSIAPRVADQLVLS